MWSKNGYGYGFQGMEKDDEVKGSGNSYDFGARIYDPRVGRWLSVDPKAKKHPSWTPYKAMLNNPIIYLDPNGETEFYYKGKWIGTDGIDNNVSAKVTSRKIKRKIKKSTRKGLNATPTLLYEGAGTRKGMMLINNDVLKSSKEVLNLSQKEKVEDGEYARVMNRSSSFHFKKSFEKYQSENGVDGVDGLPIGGDVSIHSHPTGKNESGDIVQADKPSNEDKAAFDYFNINIIVGNNGEVVPKFRTLDNGEIVPAGEKDNRYQAINIYDKNAKKIGKITEKEAQKMLEKDTGRRGRRFKRK